MNDTLSTSNNTNCQSDTVNQSIDILLDELNSGLFKALSEYPRQQIISILLRHGRLNIQQITKFCTQDRSVISRHLKYLHEAEIVISQQEGRYTYYELNGFNIINSLRRILMQMQILMSTCDPKAWAEFEEKNKSSSNSAQSN